MALQPVSQKKSRSVQLAVSGFLVIQATIVTTTISTFVSTSSGWMSASAQETQPSVPVPGTVSTSAADLRPTLAAFGSTLKVDCLLAEEMGVRLEHCSSFGPTTPITLNPESLKKVEDAINEGRTRLLPPSNGMVHIPLMQW
ncbi:hypothetical protein C7B65_21155 [Phormidesmis priestleyi ULC007]|uniref:Uncharacterized protein n=1 Tax=Phormidesmis priestleyi ULC007 TaxID=1920490 RepID=A0A2T1D809_9CYAN|nr:hypothetical protein [Phormidesmis priestleyi]PSB16635.1 hypothetical protein C7B65_21155 [Phormidesmis priestleyi ULC007]PZO47537.1 MAG: hypothetical protein DCF14_19690 [Phormidesmis priestleyi]